MRNSLTEIRILSLWQPWASLIALGLKQYETRSWATPYRGLIAIQAAKRPMAVDEHLLLDKLVHNFQVISFEKDKDGCDIEDRRAKFPLGAIVCIANLTQCLYMTRTASDPGIRQKGVDTNISILEPSPLEAAVGNWEEGRYAWKLENIRPIAQPVPCKGAQGLRTIKDPAVLEAIEQQLRASQAGGQK